MSTPGFNYRVLVVDDEPSVLQISASVLKDRGFEVRTASDGFQVLVELRRSMPDLIISDLRMPNMSGFELLSVVRRRFPHIPVIAISGEYSGDSLAGLIADAFFVKGQYRPEELFHKIAELIEQSPIRPSSSKPDRAPVWVPQNEQGYFIVPALIACVHFQFPKRRLTRNRKCERPLVFFAERQFVTWPI